GALPRREPTRHHYRRIRKGACFARPEQEPGEQQRVVARHRARQRRERRPPHHDAREYAPRAETVAHHACRNFEETIREGEYPRHPSPPDGIDAQVLLHARPGHRDADAIEIGDGEQQDEQTDDTATVARRTRQDGRLCHSRRDYSAAIAATVLSTSRRNASIVTSRSASGVSSSLQCDKPLVERANIITAGMTRTPSPPAPRWRTGRPDADRTGRDRCATRAATSPSRRWPPTRALRPRARRRVPAATCRARGPADRARSRRRPAPRSRSRARPRQCPPCTPPRRRTSSGAVRCRDRRGPSRQQRGTRHGASRLVWTPSARPDPRTAERGARHRRSRSPHLWIAPSPRARVPARC